MVNHVLVGAGVGAVAGYAYRSSLGEAPPDTDLADFFKLKFTDLTPMGAGLAGAALGAVGGWLYSRFM